MRIVYTETKTRYAAPPTSVSKPFAKQKVISDDTPPAYDSTIYAKAIDSPAIALMHKYLPEWDFPPPSTWDKIWFNEYKKEGFLVNYIFADFNGDGKTDLALLLKNKKKYAVWVLQSRDDKYEAIKLLNIGQLKETTIDIGIELCPKGRLDYI